MKSKTWLVYIIQTESGRLYTGITTDIDRRLAEHFGNGKKTAKGAKFFRFSKPSQIVYSEKHLNRSSASKREAEIKKMSRRQKLVLTSMSADRL